LIYYINYIKMKEKTLSKEERLQYDRGLIDGFHKCTEDIKQSIKRLKEEITIWDREFAEVLHNKIDKIFGEKLT